MEQLMNKKCESCRFARFKDEGYSNYTVEGTTFECLINKHPDGKFDRWYGEDGRLYWALWCKTYEAGTPIRLCVDGNLK